MGKGKYELAIQNEMRIVSVNQDYGFILKRETEEGDWTLAELTKPELVIDKKMGIVLPNADAYEGLMVETIWLDEFINLDSFKTTAIRKAANEENVEVIEVEFDCDIALDEHNRLQGGVLRFDPVRFWTLTDYEIKAVTLLKGVGNNKEDRKGVLKKTFTYQDLDGYPFPKSIKTQSIPDNFPASCIQTEYDDVSRNIDAKECHISHYGFSEPASPTKRGNRIRFFLMAAGVILIIGALYLRRRVPE